MRFFHAKQLQEKKEHYFNLNGAQKALWISPPFVQPVKDCTCFTDQLLISSSGYVFRLYICGCVCANAFSTTQTKQHTLALQLARCALPIPCCVCVHVYWPINLPFRTIPISKAWQVEWPQHFDHNTKFFWYSNANTRKKRPKMNEKHEHCRSKSRKITTTWNTQSNLLFTTRKLCSAELLWKKLFSFCHRNYSNSFHQKPQMKIDEVNELLRVH